MTTSVKKPLSMQLTNMLISIWNLIKRIPPVYPVFVVIMIAVGQLNPNFATADGILLFLRRSSPLAILAMGQVFVLATGGFDLTRFTRDFNNYWQLINYL